MKKIEDYAVTDSEIEDVLCPRCWADPLSPCATPRGQTAMNHHSQRVRKAQSIARDLAVAGCLPEHDPEAYALAMKKAHATASPSP